jgi:hypothetical protein
MTITECPACGQHVRKVRTCQCSTPETGPHTEGGHDIRGNGSRGACSRLTGPTGKRCDCKQFTPVEPA